MVNDSGEFVGCCGNGFRSSQAATHSAVERAKGGTTALKRLSSHPQSGGEAVFDFACSRPKDFAATDIIVRTKPQPGGERRWAPKLRKIRADFGNSSLDMQHTD